MTGDRPTDEEPGSFKAATLATLRLPAWMYLYLGVALSGWILLTMLATPWQPTIITSGSMAPALRTGDVVFLSEPTVADVAQRSIVSYRTEEGTGVLHRVFSVEDGHYVTKGDANISPDTEPLRFERIDGVGRLVVPYVGLPVVWWLNGQFFEFGSWLGLTIVALLFVAGQVRRRDRIGNDDAKSAVAQVAIRQVRTLVILMVIAQYIVDSTRFTVVSSLASPLAAMAITVVVLSATNLISLRADRLGDQAKVDRSSLVGLAADTALVVVIATATGSSGIGWILFALPIIEAAARSRLTGALIAWMSLTLSTFGLRIAIANSAGTTSAVLLDDLDSVMDQLSVLLLIVVPGAYLAEQLLTDVVEHRRATSTALGRSELLQRVVDHGRDVTQLDRSLFETLVSAVESLGFAGADIVVRMDRQKPWQILAASDALDRRPIPSPGDPGSTVTSDDLQSDAVYVDGSDPNRVDAGLIDASGWGSLVRITLPTGDDSVVGVRAVLDAEVDLDPDAVDGLNLLLGQASVGLRNNHLLDELWEVNHRMKHASTHDALTELPNRVLVMENLTNVLSDAAPTSAVAVLFLDLNGFKPINDRLGHDAGDVLLRLVAERLSNQVELPNQVARLGGDEFVVVITGLDSPERAEMMANGLCEIISAPFTLGSDPVKISTAIGISYAEGPNDPAEMIRRADVAMYRAKTESHVNFVHFEPSMDAAGIRTARLSAELPSAMRLGQVHMHFQPMIDRVSGRIEGVEALVRWEHPELGSIAASDLIAMAESSGRAAELNRWILDESLQSARQIQAEANLETFFVAVNASLTEIKLPTFVDHVSMALEFSGVPANNVLIELSEGLVLDDDPIVLSNVSRLADIGVRVMLDDFGEGKTTLGHLRRLPLFGLKLDRSFLVQLDDEPQYEIIMRSIVSMAHELGICVIAEGIEKAEHLLVAERTKVDLLQGYYCGRPMPLHALIESMSLSAGQAPSDADGNG